MFDLAETFLLSLSISGCQVSYFFLFSEKFLFFPIFHQNSYFFLFFSSFFRLSYYLKNLKDLLILEAVLCMSYITVLVKDLIHYVWQRHRSAML